MPLEIPDPPAAALNSLAATPAGGTAPTLSTRNYTLGLDAVSGGRGLPAAQLGV